MFLFSFRQLRSLTFDFHILSLALITTDLQAKKWTNKFVDRVKKKETPLFFNYTGTGDIWSEHMVASAFSYLQF